MEQEKHELIDRVECRFTLAREQLEFGDQSYQFYYCADVEQLMRRSDLTQSNDPHAQPYWGQIWESSVGLCRWLQDCPLQEKSLLDMGCGLGIVGACAASRGAHVVSVDAVPAAIELARLNAWRWRERVNCQVLDWNKDQLDQEFDYIVGADIVYDQEDWQSLSQFWRTHLRHNGSVILVEPTRRTGYEFAKWISTQNWQLETAKLGSENDIALQLIKLTQSSGLA